MPIVADLLWTGKDKTGAETRELINLACKERKLKRAADLIYEDLWMLRWDEVALVFDKKSCP